MPKKTRSEQRIRPSKTPTLTDPLSEVDRTLLSIRKQIRRQRAAEAPNSEIEKLRGRELAALRLRSNVVAHLQKLTLRLLDSPEWSKLADAIVSCVAPCERCAPLLDKLLDDHGANAK